jgi:hypothetical protein
MRYSYASRLRHASAVGDEPTKDICVLAYTAKRRRHRARQGGSHRGKSQTRAAKKGAPSSPAGVPANPGPNLVQTWVEVVDRPDRSVFGWLFIAEPRRASIAVIGIAINVDHWLVERALVTQDAPLITYMLGMCLGELLTYRARHTPWLPVLLEKLREALFKGRGDDLRKLIGVQFLGQLTPDERAQKDAIGKAPERGGNLRHPNDRHNLDSSRR